MRKLTQTLFAILIAASLPALLLAQNRSLSFDGNSDYACAIGNRGDVPHDDLTIEFWFKTGNANGGIFAITTSDPGFRDYDRCVSIEGGSIFQYVWSAQAGEIISCRENGFANNQWHHYAMVIQSGQGQFMYLDGELLASGNLDHTGFDWADRIQVGHSIRSGGQERWFNGLIDEVRFWTVAKTRDQIRASMHVPLRGNEDNLWAYYRCDEGQGQSVADDSPSDHALRLGSGQGGDNNDPSWSNEGAPLSGAIAELSLDRLDFPPLAAGQRAMIRMEVRNTAQVDDEFHALNFSFADLGQAPNWISVDPAEGSVAAGHSREVTFTALAGDLQPGNYRRTIRLTTGARNMLQLDIPALLPVAPGTGRIYGEVTSALDNATIAGATIEAVADFQLSTVTDLNGLFEFNDLATGSYRFRVSKEGFLPFTTDQIDLPVNQERNFDAQLYFAQLTPSPENVNVSLAPNGNLNSVLTIGNTGNGPLTWRGSVGFPRDHVAEQWEQRLNFNVTGGEVDDQRINGIEYVDGFFYIAGGNNGRGTGNIYVFDHEGRYVRRFPQFLQGTQQGMRDLAFDGSLIWGADGGRLFGFDTSGNLSHSFEIPLNICRGVAFDPETNRLWITDLVQSFYVYDLEGHQISNYRSNNLRRYGLAWYPEDPDGYKLWMFVSDVARPMAIYKMNPANRDTAFVYNVPLQADIDRPGGMAITGTWDPYNWVMVGQTFGNPDAVSLLNLSARTNWLRVRPLAGRVDPGGSQDVGLTFDSNGYPPNTRLTADMTITNDGEDGTVVVPISMSVTDVGGVTQRMVTLERGWNLVSVNVEPDSAESFQQIVAPLVDAGRLIIAKNGLGNYFWPARGFGNIERWNGTAGYWMKLRASANLSVTGGMLAANTPIDLDRGWNTVSYLPRVNVAAPTALAGLGGNLILARDGYGRFYLPAYGYNDIPPMHEGAGYQVKVTEAGQLVYRTRNAAGEATPRYTNTEEVWISESRLGDGGESSPLPVHFLLFRGNVLEAGDRIEALSPEGRLVGRGLVGEDRQAGVAVWGDDTATPDREGLRSGERPTIMLNGVPVTEQAQVTGGSIEFGSGDFGVLDLAGAGSPLRFDLTTVYPNPFNESVRINYMLASAGPTRLALYDLTGREVALMANEPQSAGVHSLSYQARGLPTGLYILRLESGAESRSLKVMLLK